MVDEGRRWPVEEKKMTLEELVGWLDDNDVSYEVDDAGRLTVKGDLRDDFRHWVEARRYTGLPDELAHVDGALWLKETSIVSLGGLISVKGGFDLRGTSVTSLDNLTSVGGYLDLNGTSITSLGNLASVGEYLDLNGTPIASLGNLTSVGRWLDLRGAPITSFGNLTSVGGWLDLQKTPITFLGNLTSVGGDLDLRDTPITSLDDLPQVGRDLLLDKIQFQLLTREVLRKTAGKIKYKDPSKDLLIPLSPSELETIITENEARESLQNTRKTDVDWDLYDR